MTRSLGLDVGDRRIGVALGDPQGILASPLTIIDGKSKSEESAIKAITDIVNRYQVEQIVVGLPLSMDGSLGKQAEKVQAFTRSLSRHSEVPLEFRDERLSTMSAKRLMREASTKRNRKQARHDDAVAAAIILQGYLDESSA